MHLYEKGIFEQQRLPCQVVSIGNLTVGGTGKTPMVSYVADLLQGLGLKVAVLSRGYGGKACHCGGIVSDGKTRLMGREASGDEPQLLASKLKGVPILVGKDRYQAGQHAIRRFGASVLVLDDGFQHLALKRDLNFLLLDSERPFGNGHCIPRGPLREPMEQVKRASAFILTRWQGNHCLGQHPPMLDRYGQGQPIFKSMHVPQGLFWAGSKQPLDLVQLKGKKIFAFSGIARNDSFRESIFGLGGDVSGFSEFPDHHRYSRRALGLIWKEARALKVDHIITTEKDWVNICPEMPTTPPLLVLGISISFGDDANAFAAYVRRALKC